MLTEDGILKVTDFGISRSLDDGAVVSAGSSAVATSVSDSLTRTGSLMGTPMYMSPEQARGERLDPRSDIYSLGLTLHFLLSGRDPYDSGDMYDLTMRQCHDEPLPLEGKVRDLTPERSALLARMIAKDRDCRFADYNALLVELEDTAPKSSVLATFIGRAAAWIIDYVVFALFATLPVLCIEAALGLLSNEVWTLFQDAPWDGVGHWSESVKEYGPLLVGGFVYVFGIGWYGRTPGKWLLGLKAVRPGRRTVGLSRALLRGIMLYLPFLCLQNQTMVSTRLPGAAPILTATTVAACIAFPVSALLIAFTGRHRGLHDLLAGTVVLSVPRQRKRRR